MKKLSIPLLFCLAATTQAAPLTDQPGVVFMQSHERGLAACQPQTQLACAQAVDQRALQANKDFAYRKGLELHLKLARGEAVLKNAKEAEEDPEAVQAYYYLDRLASLNSHLVGAGFWEGTAYLLVNQTSGKRTELAGAPIQAPSGPYFLTTSMDLEAGFNPNRIEVWENTENAVKRAASFDIKARGADAWGPQTVTWKSATVAEVLKSCWDTAPKAKTLFKPCGSVTIELKGTHWRLTAN